MAEIKSIMPQAHAHAHEMTHEGAVADAGRSDYGPDEHHDPDYEAPRLI